MTDERHTLLTADPTPEQIDQQRRTEETQTKVRTLVFDVWLQAYREGEVDLEVLLREARKLLKRLNDQRLLERSLGYLVEQALSCEPPKRGRGNKGRPSVLRKLAVGVVDLVVEHEGLTRNRETKGGSAFQRASDLLMENGVSATARQIEGWYYQPK